MPVSKQTEEFLRYATKNLEKGKDAKISNKDKTFAPYIINEYTTWGQLYDAAVKKFKSEGGNELEVGKIKFGPNYKLPTGSPFAMTTQQANLDPLASAVDSNNLRVTTDESGNSTLRANVEEGSVEHYLYVREGKDRFGKPSSEVIIRTDFDEIANITITDYQSKPGGINTLFDSLYKKNLITKETYNSKNISAPDFRKGLQYAIRQYGVSSVDARTFNKKLTVGTLGEYLSGNALTGTNAGGGSKTVTDIRRQETTRPDSDEEANRFSMENIGRNATKEEKDAYFKMLNAAEKKAVVKSVGTTGDTTRSGVDSGSFIDLTDKTLMLGKIFANSIAGSDLDTIIKSGAGAAQSINSIKTYAQRYGINLSDEQAMGYVVNNLKTGKDMASSQAKIQKLSKIKYGNLANFIDDDTSVEDIASEAMYKVSQLTGLSYKSLSVNNSVVAKALANNGKPGVMTDAEIDYLIKTDPETKSLWLKTPKAKEEAAGYANGILRMFGLGT